MRRLLLAVTLILCGCTGNLTAGASCGSDAECDPGDSCQDGACATPVDLRASSVTANPSAATVTAAAGATPPPASFQLNDTTKSGHSFSISCSGGATATPASGKVSNSKPATVVVQAQPAEVSATVACQVTTSAASVHATFTLAVSVESGGGGGGAIGPAGGAVDLLDFVLTGDTRPPACEDTAHYPAAIHAQIVRAMSSLKPQFGLDLGDHMYVCNQDAAEAQQQMGLYLQGLQGFPAYFAMTMGNHECESTDCSAKPSDANYAAFLSALSQVSKQSSPNYALQIQTRLGRVTLVVIADNSFGTAQQAWLQSTLTDADTGSIATIVAKHHPMTGSRTGPGAPFNIVQQHKYSLILTAHDHQYGHDQTAFGGRSVICGLGGANTAHTGFCRVQQGADGALRFTQYDATGNPHDSWSVQPR